MLTKIEWVKNNKAKIAMGIAFLAGGLHAIGYSIPQPLIEIVYSLLGLGSVQ